MPITIPLFAEARQILQDKYPGVTLSDSIIERARYRIAVGLSPHPGEDDTIERIIRKVIDHENRLDALEGNP